MVGSKHLRRARSKEAARFPGAEQLENRTLLSGYTATPIASVPAPQIQLTSSAADDTPLARDAAGNLYGYDPVGGAAGAGIIYKVTPSTGTLATLYTGGVAALTVDPQGDVFAVSQNSNPNTLYELPAGATTPTTLYTFATGGSFGTYPEDVTIDSANNVYVLTGFGAANNGGGIVKFTPTTGYTSPTLLASNPTSYFSGYNSITVGSSGNIYVTSGGGGDAASDGTLTELPAGSSTVNTLADFDRATTGALPDDVLVDSAGNVYGANQSGGADDGGTVWKYTAATGTLSTLATFDYTDESEPLGQLAFDPSGNLIGTSIGNSEANGNAFEVNVTTGAPTTLTTFTASSAAGTFPETGLIADGAGNFYGVTTGGGANSRGTVFELSPSSGSGTGTGTGTGTGSGTGSGTTGSSSLTATVARSTVPTSVIAGATTKGTVAVTVTNTTAAILKGTAKVALYASTDGSIDSTSTLIATVSRPVKLKSSKAASIAVPVKKLSLPAGTYTLLAQVTDPSGNTSVATGSALTVAPATITLSGNIGAVTPSATTPGKSISFTLTLANSGNVNSTGAAQLAVYLSTDGASLSIPVSTITKRLTIRAGGKPVAVRLKVKVPTTAAAMNLFPLVGITQGTATATVAGTGAIAIG